MHFSQFTRLLFIAAIWGASHVFARIIVPALGPVLSVFARVTICALTLTILILLKRELLPLGRHFRSHWKPFLAVGTFNMAIPFLLFSYSAVTLPASYLVILNATVPIFSAIFSSLFAGEPFGPRRWISIVLGFSGVVLLTEYGSIVEITPAIALAIASGLVASASYGGGTLYIRMKASHLKSEILVWGSNLTALFLISGFSVWSFVNHGEFSPGAFSWWWVGTAVVLLGAFSSGIAFVMFYRLVTEVGAFTASLATFVMPMFGLAWGVSLLDETVTFGMICGAALVISSAALFVKKQPPPVRG